ncbi:MAG: methyltransferase domain-containing protein [Anaerolineales bacterium]|nr:MAG: methyltransferase domain-containing protein [Anaerolineales bacterium]
MTGRLQRTARRILSRSTRRRLARLAVWPPVGWVRFGHLRRLKPVSSDYGNSRGLEIDRYYIEKFLSEHSADIHGHVLEIKHNTYTMRFGGERVTKSDVLHPVQGNPEATLIADLTHADHIPADTFDTIIFTQTLQFIYDHKTTLATLYRILKPKGVLLATTPGISQIIREDFDLWGEYWRFTSLSARLIFEEIFPQELVTVRAYGNVLAAISFLQGLAREDLKSSELDATDSDYEILIAIRAVKPVNIE